MFKKTTLFFSFTLLFISKSYAFDFGKFFETYCYICNTKYTKTLSNFIDGKTKPKNNLTGKEAQLEIDKTLNNTKTESHNTNNDKILADLLKKKEEDKKLDSSVLDTTAEGGKNFQENSAQTLANIQQAQNPNPYLPETNKNNTPQIFNFTMADAGDFSGQFVCNKNNGGSVSGIKSKDCQPKNQGGEIADELFYSVVNAAEISGLKVNLISCKRSTESQAAIYANKSPGTAVAAPGTSKHEIGEALDVTFDGSTPQKTKFILAVLANTDKMNSIGNYAGDKHTHIGSDRGQYWTSFGVQPELYKINAFLRAGTTWFTKTKSKKDVSERAKTSLKELCN